MRSGSSTLAKVSAWSSFSANNLILILGVLALVIVSLASLNQSLWIDELITAWIVRDRMDDVVVRATTFQGQSPFYFLLAWTAGYIFGLHEWALRLPSLFLNLCTVGLFYRCLRRHGDRDLAASAAGSLALLVATARPLQEARPYALALCCFVLSLDFLMRWALSGKRSEMFGFVCAAMGVFYAHYLFAIAFPLYGVVLVALRRDLRLSIKDLFVAALMSLLLSVPAAWQLYLLTGKAELYSFSGSPTFMRWLVWVFGDQGSLCLLAITAFVYCFGWSIGERGVRRIQGQFLVGLVLWLYPGVAAAALSYVSGTPIFVPRYFAYAVLGEGLVRGVLLCIIRSGWLRVGVFVVLVIWSAAPQTHNQEHGWRAALASVTSLSVDATSVVLLNSGLCETRDVAWTRRPENRQYLLCPTAFYPISPRTIPLPYFLESLSPTDIFSEEELSALAQARRIIIVGPQYTNAHREFDGQSPIKIPWLSPHEPLRVIEVRKIDGMAVVELERVGAEPKEK